MAELRPKVQFYESENRKLRKELEKVEASLQEATNEVQTLKQKIQNDGDLMAKYSSLRDTMSKSKGGNANRASRISQI